MFNKIEDLRDLAVAANNPYTDTQLVNFGLDFIKKTNDYEKALIAWYNHHPTQQTYQAFKTHFIDA